MLEQDQDHDPDVLRARTYASTRDLDPDVPEQLAQAEAELQEMNAQQRADYTDGLRWQASVTGNHALLNAALVIDDPELALPASDDVDEDITEPDPSTTVPQRAEPARFRTALRRARAALTWSEQSRPNAAGSHRAPPGTDRDLSL